MDIHICAVNKRPPTSRILAELLLTCGRCANSRREHVGTGDEYGSLFDFAAGWKFRISPGMSDRHIQLHI